LGSDFDCFGAALQIYLEVEMDFAAAGLEITASGEHSAGISTDTSNLVFQAAQKIFRHTQQTPPALKIKIKNSIPVFRGLGSSGAAVVAGLLCGNQLANARLNNSALLNLANELEGHPENAAASLLGGATINCVENGRVISKKFTIEKSLQAVIFISDAIVSTHDARRVLPKTVAHADAVFNLQRSALLAHALIACDYSALKTAMQDRLHQPFRKPLIPGFDEFEKIGYDNGALGVCISGSGSAILGVTEKRAAAALFSAWEALRLSAQAGKKLKIGGKVVTCGFENDGAQILR
jgi:homoserine kinase